MKLLKMTLIALILGIFVGLTVGDVSAWFTGSCKTDNPLCWYWERVADGGGGWSRTPQNLQPPWGWHVLSGEGWCGNIDSTCFPNQMTWKVNEQNLECCASGVYATWDHAGNTEAEHVDVFAFIPDVKATTSNAHYAVSFNGSLTHTYVSQISYSDEWVFLSSGYHAQYTDLSHITGENPHTTHVGFDEVQNNYYSWTPQH
jgi:hypothetical protein